MLRANHFKELRRWHVPCILLVLAVCAAPMLAGCVLPETLETVEDVNYGPLVMPDPSNTMLVTIPAADGNLSFVLTIEDANPQDTIYVKYFLDYVLAPGDAIAGGAVSPAEGATDIRRTLSTTIKCGMAGENAIPTDGKPHLLTAVVADRPFVNEIVPTPPRYRHVTPPGKWSEVEWQVECTP